MKINENNSELIGALIGEGYIYRKNRKYQIGFVGHPVTDKEYFEYLRGLIRKEWDRNPKINIRERGARMVVNSKEICEFLIGDLNIAHGKGKSERVRIPKEILKNWNLTRRAIR